MSEKTNIYGHTDQHLIKLCAGFIRHNRLQQNKTQAQLATDAGINRSTLAEFENGKSINLTSFIRLLRSLNLLYTLEQFQVQQQLSPLQLAEMEFRQRKRASKTKKAAHKRKSDW